MREHDQADTTTTDTVTAPPVRPTARGADPLFGLQRLAGNQATAQLIAHRPSARGGHLSRLEWRPPAYGPVQTARQPAGGPATVLQRRVMSDQEWEQESFRIGKYRSTALLKIDQALMAYNRSHDKSVEERAQLLREVRSAIFAWKRSKPIDEGTQVESSRAESVEKLKERVYDELEELTGSRDNLTTAGGIREAVASAFEAAGRRTRDILAITPASEAQPLQAGMQDYVDRMDTALQLFQQLQQSDERPNAEQVASAGRHAARALKRLTEGYVTSSDSGLDDALQDLSEIREYRSQLVDGTTGKGRRDYYNALFVRMADQVEIYYSVVKAAVQPGGKSKPDTEMVDAIVNLIDQSTSFSGFFGTGGKTNEGLNAFYKPKTEGESELTKDVRETFNVGEKLSSGGQNAISGTSDSLNHLAGIIGDTTELYKAVQTWKDPKSSSTAKSQAAFVILGYGPKLISRLGGLTGGLLTLSKQGKKTLPKSMLGFGKTDGTDNGTDLSTDTKFIGDIGGWVAGAIDTISKVVTLFKELFDKDTYKDNSALQNLELVGQKLSQLATIGQSVAGNHRAGARLVAQAQGGGQVSQVGKDLLASITPAELMPAMGIITGSLGAIRYGYGLAKVGMRRWGLSKQIAEARETRTTNLETMEALEFTKESLVKRSIRTGILLGHSLASIAASGLDLSGIGAAPGQVIKIASAALKVGQIGLRMGKQKSRDLKVKSREKKDLDRGFHETFAEWKLRQKVEAGEGFGNQLVKSLDIMITRNWDKSSIAKTKSQREAALAILAMAPEDRKKVFEALGIDKKKLNSTKTKLDLVLEALKKREP